jgi:hypothetical protein
MIRHIWSVLCSTSVRDADSHNVSLFNVIEQLRATLRAGAPKDAALLLPMPLELVTLWERGDWESSQDAPGVVARANVRILDPTGKELGGGELLSDLSERRRCRSKLQFGGLPLTVSGRYVIQVTLYEDDDPEGRVVAEVPLDVVVSREEADEAILTS